MQTLTQNSMAKNTTNTNMQITFIGGGNMAQAIIGGLKANGFNTSQITVIEPTAEKRTTLSSTYGVQTLDSIDEIRNTSVASTLYVLAVKPQQLKAVCTDLSLVLNQAVQQPLIVSIAAGVKTSHLSAWLNGYQNIVRVMPNTPAMIQAGVSALFATPQVSAAERGAVSLILKAVGSIVWLETEDKMDAVTAISGSGPAYVFYFIEALEAAGLALGLTAQEAKQLALETFAGASQLALQSNEDVATLRAQVTSKGGTTEQGILALETANTKAIIMQAARAAAEKSVQLGKALSES